MIEYKYKEEKEIALHYAKRLKNDAALRIINDEKVKSPEDVKIITAFYWCMVDLNNKENELHHQKYDDMEEWLARIHASLHTYFNNHGYGDIWNNESR